MLRNASKVYTNLFGRFLYPVVISLFTTFPMIINELTSPPATRHFTRFITVANVDLFLVKESSKTLEYLKIFVKFVSEDNSVIKV